MADNPNIIGGYDTTMWPVAPRLCLQHMHGHHSGRLPTMYCPMCEVEDLRVHLRAAEQQDVVTDEDRIIRDTWKAGP